MALGNIMDWTACILFNIDAAIGCIGRWRYILATPYNERLRIVRVCCTDIDGDEDIDTGAMSGRRCTSAWRRVDWMAHGDILFLIGSFFTLHNQISDSAVSCAIAYVERMRLPQYNNAAPHPPHRHATPCIIACTSIAGKLSSASFPLTPLLLCASPLHRYLLWTVDSIFYLLATGQWFVEGMHAAA